ncbi:MAG: aldo/keto reductase [Oscillospiraceae bacterium]|nr:aldo/keto reductase [Oscillospiraceae bacterium]
MAYLGEDIRNLGFGLMRLPRLEDGSIDIEQTKEMVDLFMGAGFTYFDTAWAYGGSEEACKAALVDRYPRESFQLATKNAAWIDCKTREDAIAQFDTSLRKTGAGYFDFYLLHNIAPERKKFFDDFGMWDFIREKKEEGAIKHIGFSFHSTPEFLDEVLTEHPEVEFVQLQINYKDWEEPTVESRACYEMARKHGKSVIIMEPVKGGLLANPPEKIKAIFREAEPDSSCASWAIRFAASLDGLITVLSGMSNVDQMKDNLATMKDFSGFTDEQKEVVAKAQKAFNEIPLIQCTACDYCAKVCPMGIAISGSFAADNFLTLYGDMKQARRRLDSAKGDEKLYPTECIKCGACESVCPQHLTIRDLLEKVTADFSL